MFWPPARDLQSAGLQHVHSIVVGNWAQEELLRGRTSPQLWKAYGSGTRCGNDASLLPCLSVGDDNEKRNVRNIKPILLHVGCWLTQ